VQADATVVTAVTPRRNVRDGRAVILDPPKAAVILYAQPVPRRQLDPSLRLLALSLFFSFSLSLSLSLFQKRKVTARINRRRKTPFDTQFVGGSILLGRESILQNAIRGKADGYAYCTRPLRVDASSIGYKTL